MNPRQLKNKTQRRGRRKAGIRKRVIGTPECPRLSVFRSAKHIYAQVIDDLAGKTLVAASTVTAGTETGGNIAAAEAVGKALAEKAKAAGVGAVQFDRNGYRYHGRVKALADSAREAGLQF
ncbi:50S ribosomal protein L18 [Mucisphaera calidilacus]|uniref:Large ribosomal subunit protein uL18 n=1 Tax=Mucisphaera calidilacus TaxID=2527982 RepID=A0A518BXR4_9BACT|nr:50S ribosomal protein L18 [Mucisphaera calidilacus]QDU71760.1 50S ribosomal protein L18 [Mucisphaera calidilacus]